MSTRKCGTKNAAEHEAVTVEIDPRYESRHTVEPSPQASTKPAANSKAEAAGDEPTDGWARSERVLARWGAYWRRACADAWFTVFPSKKRDGSR